MAREHHRGDSTFSTEKESLPMERVILELVSLVYDAAADARRWPSFLEKFGAALGTTANSLFLQNFSNANTPARLSPKECFIRSLEQFLREQRSGDLLDTVRNKNSPFSQEDIRVVASLKPHLQRAVRLQLRIAVLEAQQQATSDALNRWFLGVILLNSKGGVLMMNRAAELILNQRDGLVFDSNGLRATRSSETVALQKLINGTIHLSKRGSPGGALALSRAPFKRPLSILVTPSSPKDRLFRHSSAAATMFVSDPEIAPEPQNELLGRLYGFTPAEEKVALLLMEGKSISDVAQTLRVSLNTARTHLKRIFDKTQTHRQGDLVRLLLTGPALTLPSARTRSKP